MQSFITLRTLAALLLAALFVPAAAPAQDILLSENFNGSWSTVQPPAGWRIVFGPADTSSNDWHRAPDLELDPWTDNATPYALLHSQPPEIQNVDSLISPSINCSDFNLVVLRCSTYYGGGEDQPYRIALVGSVDGGPFEHVVFDYYQRIIGPELQVLALPWAANRSNVRLAWAFDGITEHITFWAIDDVSVTGMNSSSDVGVLTVETPIGAVDSNHVVRPEATVKNYGASAETFWTRMTIGSGYTDTTLVDDLGPGSTRRIAFRDWTATERGVNHVLCRTMLTGDINPANDRADTAVTVVVRDAGVFRITLPPDTVDSGMVVTPQARVKNFGTETISAFYCYFRIQAWLDSVLVENLVPRVTRDVTFREWQAETLGTIAMACSTGYSDDMDTRNDILRSSFVVGPPHHNVGVEAILVPTGSIYPGPVLPSARIRNYGGFTESFGVKFRIRRGGSVVYIDSIYINGLQPRASQDVTFLNWNATLGSYVASCSTELAGDAVPSNDASQALFTVDAPPIPPGWTEMAPMPKPPSNKEVKRGGALTLTSQSDGWFIYALKGNKTGDFYRYNVAVDAWEQMKSVPDGPSDKQVYKGGALCNDGGHHIYAVKGNNTVEFWRYGTTDTAWTQMANIPLGATGKKIKGGTKMQYLVLGDTGWVYLLKGYKNEFYRYNTVTGVWDSTLTSAPLGNSGKNKYKYGSFIVHDGAGTIYCCKSKYNETFAYDVANGSWLEQLADMPFVGRAGRRKKLKDGGSGAWLINQMFCLKGGNTQEFWQYSPWADSWYELDTMPSFGSTGRKKRVKYGADLVSLGNGLFFALKGNKTMEFWRYNYSTGPGIRTEREPALLQPIPFGSRLVIQPNPARTQASIALSGTDAAIVQVFDADGKLLRTQTAIPSFAGYTLNLQGMSPGIYFVRAEQGTWSGTGKLIVE